MIKESNMIRASDLKVGDKIISTTGIEYEVIENHVGGVLFILNENGEAGHIYNGLHLFYDDIDYLDYAKDILNIDLSLAQSKDIFDNTVRNN